MLKFVIARSLCLVGLTLAAAPAFAIDGEVLALINEGNTFLEAGDLANAEISYTNAKGIAANKRDWDGMLNLSDRYLTIGEEYHGKDCFLIASQIGHERADAAPSDGDPDAACADAINVLDSVSLWWEATLSSIAMSAETLGAMQQMATIAWDNARWYETNGCP